MAELLEEFDQPSPLPVSFCQQIPSEEFDKRSAQNTRDALHDLINHIEAKPEEFYKIVRRKKADNLKLFQYLKVKVLNKLQDDYLEKYFPENQCREELENLMHDMESAFNYAQDGKQTGIRFSRRLAEKRKVERLYTSTPKKPTAPPPPPPPPPIMSADSKGLISPVHLPADTRLTYQQIPRTPSGTFRREEELLQSIRSIPARRKLHDKNSYTEAVQSKPGVNQKRINNSSSSVHLKNSTRCPSIDDLAAARNSLRLTGSSSGSPDDSPYQRYKSRKENEKPKEDNFSMFNMELLQKFRNTYSPSDGRVSPSGQILTYDSGFESP
ncbi:unnamed protein product [Porites evermanni]|uniref:Uncharacterized protein n=1 Tax=Porites evermanni TaxID=104178 RepID=A0ABN8LMD7_9CNID|nr:unnamed protein product [Porites evermanni]